MPELVAVGVIAIVCKNIVNVIKMFKDQLIDALAVIGSGVAGLLLVWVLNLDINIFQNVGVQTTQAVCMVNGALIGFMGQDFYKLMKLIQRKTSPAEELETRIFEQEFDFTTPGSTTQQATSKALKG